MPTSPTPPIELLGSDARLPGAGVEVPEEAIHALASICETIESDGTTVDAVAEARQQVPEVRLTIVGTGPSERRLQHRSNALALRTGWTSLGGSRRPTLWAQCSLSGCCGTFLPLCHGAIRVTRVGNVA